MPEDRTVLDQLLEGRDALQREVARLTAAIEQLDAVLGRIGTTVARSDRPINPLTEAAETVGDTIESLAPAGPVTPPVTATSEPVNPPVEVEAAAPSTVRATPRAVRKMPTKKTGRPRRSGASLAAPPKSIRVHVLEMLQAENRDFGLAEIIDRVHDAGIQAHDDAVRSITIKLMKDGRVERVGRGQYRLARRGSAARASAAVATAPRITETAPEPTTYPTYVPPAVDDPEPSPAEATTTDTPTEALAPEALTVNEAPTGDAQPWAVDAPGSLQPGPVDPGFADQPVGDGSTADQVDESDSSEEPERTSYAPSLNLGQPWNS